MPLNPPPIIDAGLVLVTQKLLRSDMTRAAIVTFSLFTDEAINLATAQDMADDFQANFNSNLALLFDTEVFIEPPTIKLGQGTDVPLEAVAAGAGTNGTNSGAFTPPNVAVLFKKSTGSGGKANRGRTYMPFCAAQSLVSENGTLDPTLLSSFTTHGETFRAQLATDHQEMIISNKIFNVPLPPHHVTRIKVGFPVTSWVPEATIATQRRRLDRN